MQRLATAIPPATPIIWAGMPVLVTVLLGGFAVNGAWCILLNFRNKTGGDYFNHKAPVAHNVIWAGLAGAIWCSQFVSFKTAEPRMGATSYIGWAVLMASQILFSQILGLMLGEWRGASPRTVRFLSAGLVLLLLSAVLAAYSGYLGTITAVSVLPRALSSLS
jgi:L-rhamnose-H+ transport protein